MGIEEDKEFMRSPTLEETVLSMEITWRIIARRFERLDN